MPLTKRGRKIMNRLKKTYKSLKKAKSIFYALRNSGKIKKVDRKRGKK
jgi:hypothetical protein